MQITVIYQQIADDTLYVYPQRFPSAHAVFSFSPTQREVNLSWVRHFPFSPWSEHNQPQQNRRHSFPSTSCWTPLTGAEIFSFSAPTPTAFLQPSLNDCPHQSLWQSVTYCRRHNVSKIDGQAFSVTPPLWATENLGNVSFSSQSQVTESN